MSSSEEQSTCSSTSPLGVARTSLAENPCGLRRSLHEQGLSIGIADAHFKWPEIIEMNSTTPQKTITELRKLFAAYGLPMQLVSNNGPQFISEDFA